MTLPRRLQTKYAADRDGPICLLLDMRGQARDRTIEVYSYGKKKVVSIPRKVIRIETEGANRWAAVTGPRWVANAEGLHGRPAAAAPMSGWSREKLGVQQTADDAEREMAEFVVKQQNKYRRLPGQRLHSMKADRRNANIFA